MGPPPGPPAPGMLRGPPGPMAGPPGPMAGPPGPGGAPPLVPRRPGGMPVAKATTVYVGKIATSIPDEIIRRLLEACGKVRARGELRRSPAGAQAAAARGGGARARPGGRGWARRAAAASLAGGGLGRTVGAARATAGGAGGSSVAAARAVGAHRLWLKRASAPAALLCAPAARSRRGSRRWTR
jgi:hypothetical protein